jgi:dienelactone hydrolase
MKFFVHRMGKVRPTRRRRYEFVMRLTACCLIWLFVNGSADTAFAEQLISLRNGLILRGNYIELATLDQNSYSAAADGGIQIRPIWMVDDGLRRTYIHRRGMVSAEPVEVPELGQRIELFQPVPDGGEDVSGIGQVLWVTPFNEYGRRQMGLRGPDGTPLVLHQGLTELTARYAKVESLVTDRSIRLDMRLAISSIDTPSLLRVFRRRMNQDDVDARLQVVRFLSETQRYGDAHAELERVLRDFPEQDQLRPQLTALVEQQAIQLLEQAELRRDSGQPKLAEAILRRFPVAQVGQVTRLRVQDTLAKIDQTAQQASQISASLKLLVKRMNPVEAAPLENILAEIEANLSAATLPRLSDFVRLGDDDSMPPENRVALAVAGWILGNGSGEQNLKIAVSSVEVRDLVRMYLAEQDPQRRAALLEQLSRLEAARAEYVSRMLPLIRPPLDPTSLASNVPGEQAPHTTQPIALAVADPSVAGLYRIGPDHEAVQQGIIAAAGQDPGKPAPVAYAVQLPPEYDPRRSYPCVVALHAAGAPAETQLNWWAGQPTSQFLAAGDPGIAARKVQPQDQTEQSSDAKPATETAPDQEDNELPPGVAMRPGNAMRHGFIVVTPRWTRPNQRAYEYTAREHDSVLRAMRDAMRRFSIDADRVFIGGHGAGGTAAWDIAVSHPDLWAGFIAIGADPGKTLHHYNANAEYVPAYIVTGDKDDRPLKRYGAILDDYMTYQHDAMVVLYRGRGREFFSEESDRIFEWMKSPAHRRRPTPKQIDAVSMRAGDRFFWWLEWEETLPGVAIDPLLWESAERIKAAEVSASIGVNNEVLISQAPAKAFTVWLAPHMPLDFNQKIAVRYRTRRVDFEYDGSLKTMLEDVAARADRLRPYWGRITIP